MLGGPVTGEGQVGVGVDEAGQHATAAGVEFLHVATEELCRQVGFRAHPPHLPGPDQHGPPLDEAEVGRPVPGAGHHRGRPPHEQAPIAHPSAPFAPDAPVAPGSIGIRTPRSRATAAASG